MTRRLAAIMLLCLFCIPSPTFAQEGDSPATQPTTKSKPAPEPKAEPSKPSKVRIVGSRVYVDNQPIIIYGTYRDPSDDWREFSGIRQAGFNLVHNYRFSNPQDPRAMKNLDAELDKWIADAREFLGLAEKHNVGVFLDVPRLLFKPQLSPQRQAECLTRIVNAVKNEPALWFWYLYDEPTVHAISLRKQMKYQELADWVDSNHRAYKIIKKLDPNHPVTIVDSPKRIDQVPVFSAKCCDTIWPDVYARAYGNLSVARGVIELRKRFDKPTLGVPNGGTGLAHLNRKVTFNDRTNENKPRYLRAKLHALIAADSPGLVFYWSPKYLHNVPKDTPKQWQAICKLGREIKKLQPVLTKSKRWSAGDVRISKSHWGAYNRAWELYGKNTMTNEQITAREPLMWWKRKYKGSVYLGVASDFAPTQKVSATLPFEIGAVYEVTADADRKILWRSDKGKLTPDQKNTPVAIWGYTDKTFTFLMNEAQAVVLRFDPK